MAQEVALPSRLSPGPEALRACYSQAELHKIAGGLKELAACRIAVTEKDKLIQERLVVHDSGAGMAWWQEPTTIMAGMAVSISVTALATAYLLRKK